MTITGVLIVEELGGGVPELVGRGGRVRRTPPLVDRVITGPGVMSGRRMIIHGILEVAAQIRRIHPVPHRGVHARIDVEPRRLFVATREPVSSGHVLTQVDQLGPAGLQVGQCRQTEAADPGALQLGGFARKGQHLIQLGVALLDRLDLKRGQRLLEIGCGWGTLAFEAAKRGAKVVGLTLSTEQKDWAEGKIAQAGLGAQIEIRLQDYRETAEQFEAVASVEMVEAVGQRWWGAYLDSIARNLKVGGRAALQFISIDHRLFDRYAASADFIQTYIFPGGLLLDEPSFEALARDRGLSWDNREGFGLDYARTLKCWRARHENAVARGALSGFDDRFHDLWRYYLMYCEGGFRGRALDVAQVTMTKL